MSRSSSPRLAFSNHSPMRRTAAAQMSPANGFEGPRVSDPRRWPGSGQPVVGRQVVGRQVVGRLSPRTVTFAATPDRDAFMDAWRRFIRATTKSRTDCAKVYDKTFQTACNWYDGSRIPTGDVVAHAFTLHPALAAQLLSGV